MIVQDYVTDWKILFVDDEGSVFWETLLEKGKYDYDFNSFETLQQPNNGDRVSSPPIGTENTNRISWSPLYIWIGVAILFPRLHMKGFLHQKENKCTMCIFLHMKPYLFLVLLVAIVKKR